MLANLQSIIPATTRGQVHAVAAAIGPALIAWGALGEVQAAAVVGLIVAVADLVFSIVHSTSPARTAVYGLLAAVTVALTAWGFGTDAQWAAILAVAAPALGSGFGAANTPTADDALFGGASAGHSE